MANLIFESAGTIVTVITIMMNSHSLTALRVAEDYLSTSIRVVLFVILFAAIGLALYRMGLLLHEYKNESEQKTDDNGPQRPPHSKNTPDCR